jgi:hypothetical protein
MDAWIVHDDHGLGDAWFVSLRVEAGDGDDPRDASDEARESTVYERSISYGDGTEVIKRLRAAGRGATEALDAFWHGLATVAAADLAYELTIPDDSHRPPFARVLRDPEGTRVLRAAADLPAATGPLERGDRLAAVGQAPRRR